MKTTITTNVSIVTQKQEREGDVTGLPVLTISEKHVFDTDQQANIYKEQLQIWLNELPAPNGDMHPFPRRKVAPTEAELFRLIDEIHGPDDLWVGYEPPVGIAVIDVPSFMQGLDDNPHGYWEVGDY